MTAKISHHSPENSTREFDGVIKQVGTCKKTPERLPTQQKKIDGKIGLIIKEQLALKKKLEEAVRELHAIAYEPADALKSQATFISLAALFAPLLIKPGIEDEKEDEALDTADMGPAPETPSHQISPDKIVKSIIIGNKALLSLARIGMSGYFHKLKSDLLQDLIEERDRLVEKNDPQLGKAIRKLNECIQTQERELGFSKGQLKTQITLDTPGIIRDTLAVLENLGKLGAIGAKVLGALSIVTIFTNTIKDAIAFKGACASEKTFNEWSSEAQEAMNAKPEEHQRLLDKRKAAEEAYTKKNNDQVKALLNSAQQKAQSSLTSLTKELRSKGIDLAQTIDPKDSYSFNGLLFQENRFTFDLETLRELVKDKNLDEIKAAFYHHLEIVNALSAPAFNLVEFKKLLNQDPNELRKVAHQAPLDSMLHVAGNRKLRKMFKKIEALEEGTPSIRNLLNEEHFNKENHPELSNMIHNDLFTLKDLEKMITYRFNSEKAQKKIERQLNDPIVQEKIGKQLLSHQAALSFSIKNALKVLESKKLARENFFVTTNKNLLGNEFAINLMANLTFGILCLIIGATNPFVFIPFLICIGASGVMMGISLYYLKTHKPNLYQGWFFNIKLHSMIRWNQFKLIRKETALSNEKKVFYQKAQEYLRHTETNNQLKAILKKIKGKKQSAITLEMAEIPPEYSSRLQEILRKNNDQINEIKALIAEQDKVVAQQEEGLNKIKTEVIKKVEDAHQAQTIYLDLEGKIHQAKVADFELWRKNNELNKTHPDTIETVAKVLTEGILRDETKPEEEELNQELHELMKNRFGINLKQPAETTESLEKKLMRFFAMDENELVAFIRKQKKSTEEFNSPNRSELDSPEGIS